MHRCLNMSDTPHSATGSFLIVSADDSASVLRDVNSGQIYTVRHTCSLTESSVVTAEIETEPPLHSTYTITEITEERTIEIERSEQPPTAASQSKAAEQSVGELTRTERAGRGEIHVITVPTTRTETAVADILDDTQSLRERAGRIGVSRVEIRAAGNTVSIRYMP
jgi:hypothetical protein